MVSFQTREDEAAWIAQAVRAIVPSKLRGAEHDRRDGKKRGLSLADVAVLVRSSTDVRTYMQAMEDGGIPCIVRAGPDLFSQPEVLFFIGALALSGDIDIFFGAEHNAKSLPARIRTVLGCAPEPAAVLEAAARELRQSGLSMSRDTEDRVRLAADYLCRRIQHGQSFGRGQTRIFRSEGLQKFLARNQPLRRVFPQEIFHWLLAEAEVEHWDTCEGRGEVAMFHLGALSGLITGIETPGWTSANDYKWQIIGLCNHGAEDGRVPEQPLIVQPDAVTITTVHAAKGLEFAAVFLADVCARRFPSQMARRAADVPLAGIIRDEIDIDGLSDNVNNDGERRLMYVALTRAERFLVVSRSGTQVSKFIRELEPIIQGSGGTVTDDSAQLLADLKYAPLEHKRTSQLATSFSDLRYYLACPHDFYLRKVLGFAPTIDQAFGYGRGVHNLLRAIHSDPARWAAVAHDPAALDREVQKLIDHGLFYLRYTTADPARNMREKGKRVVQEYIKRYAAELRDLTFEPEKEFETMVEFADGEGGALISGAIDIVRKDNPPQVTLIDFKSGDPVADGRKLDEDEMRLQVGIYAVAAKRELEYQPQQGLVRYLDAEKTPEQHRELRVPLDDASVTRAQEVVLESATSIRDRRFDDGPRKPNKEGKARCTNCDFLGICGRAEARAAKARGVPGG